MIVVLGLGFVGLTTALGFAKKGFKTFGIDINTHRMQLLEGNEIPFYEPHLKEILQEVKGKTFFIDSTIEDAVAQSEVVFICVGTPGNEDGSADLKYLMKAVDDVLQVDDGKYRVMVIKSTVPPSTVSEVVRPYVQEKFPGMVSSTGLASNPEFLREGYCWDDFINPDRTVVGLEEDDQRSRDLLQRIYAPFNAPVHFVSTNTAEFIKYLSNTLLSTLISYSNEMSIIADKIGDINVPRAFKILHQDRRWSGSPAPMTSYIYPGCGYGGYCLPKDTAALHAISKRKGHSAGILQSNLQTNEYIKDHLVEKVAAGVSVDKTIGILGLAFKSNSDDVRFTPSARIIEKLLERGFRQFTVYDPLANETFRDEYPRLDVHYAKCVEEVVDQAEAILILTAWPEFLEKESIIKKRRLFDFRYFLNHT